MSGNVKINYEAMNAQASLIRQKSNEITETLNSLNMSLQNLLSDGFILPNASAKYQEKFGEYRTAQLQMNETLTSLGQWLDSTVQSVQALDQNLGHTLQ